MTRLVVATPEGVDLRLELAGAGSRAAAGLVDLAILLVVYLIAVLSILIPLAFDPSGVSGFVAGLLLGGGVLVFVGYHALFLHVFAGQTPGKRALGIRVVSADGHPASGLQVLLRTLLLPVDLFLALPAPIGLVLIAATPRHQRLGDLAAGTLLVHASRGRPDPEPFPGETWSGLPARSLALGPGAAAHLGPRDREVLRELLSRPRLSDLARRALFVDAARQYSERLALGPFEDARVVLKELYLYSRENAEARARATGP